MSIRASRSPRTFWFLVIAIMMLGLGIRLIAIMRLPLYHDEMLHIARAQFTLEGHLFTGRIFKWLHSVLLALFYPTGPEGPWLARVFSALSGILTISCCIALGGILDSRRTGLVAGLLYAVLPMAVFHERAALADPLLATFTMLATVMMIRLALKPRLWLALLLGAMLAGAYLTKITALPYLGLPVMAIVLFSRNREVALKALALSALGLVVAAVLVGLVYGQAIRMFPDQYSVYDLTVGLIAGRAFGEPGNSMSAAIILDNWRAYRAITLGYMGWGVTGLVLLAVLWVVLGEKRRSFLFLAIPGLLFALLLVLAQSPDAQVLVPRYLMATVGPVATLAALSLRIILTRLRTLHRGAAYLGGMILFAITLTPALWFDTALICNPDAAPLYVTHRHNWITGWGSGTGQDEIAETLVEAWREGDGQRIAVLSYTHSLTWMRAYVGPRLSHFYFISPTNNEQRERIATWLARGQSVFFISGGELERDPPHGALLEAVGTYETTMYGTQSLFRIIGAEGPLANDIYTHIAPEAERMEEDFAALATTLSQSDTRHPIVVFPAGDAATLAEMSGLAVAPAEVGVWPLTIEAVEEVLASLTLGEDGEYVEVVLVDEGHTDPGRILRLALQRSLYQLDERWVGYLHQLTYVTGPADPTMTPLDGQYEGVIELPEGIVLDREVHPGATVRVALVWQSPVPIEDSFVVFTHVMDSAEELWAQHDAVPGEGLLPTTSWQPGECIVDRFAIRLPSDIPPGEYEVRVGMAFPDSGIRLAVTGGAETGADYIVIGRLTVMPSDG